MSHTIGFLNELRIFATRCFAGLTLCDSIRKRSKACFIPFFDIDVELFMRTYIDAGHIVFDGTYESFRQSNSPDIRPYFELMPKLQYGHVGN